MCWLICVVIREIYSVVIFKVKFHTEKKSICVGWFGSFLNGFFFPRCFCCLRVAKLTWNSYLFCLTTAVFTFGIQDYISWWQPKFTNVYNGCRFIVRLLICLWNRVRGSKPGCSVSDHVFLLFVCLFDLCAILCQGPQREAGDVWCSPPLSGISGLSFDSPFLSPPSLFYLVLLLSLPCHFSVRVHSPDLFLENFQTSNRE